MSHLFKLVITLKDQLQRAQALRGHPDRCAILGVSGDASASVSPCDLGHRKALRDPNGDRAYSRRAPRPLRRLWHGASLPRSHPPTSPGPLKPRPRLASRPGPASP